jgi:hypothetical protein
LAEEDLKRQAHIYLTTGVISVNAVVRIHATEIEYTVRNADGNYIIVGMHIVDMRH